MASTTTIREELERKYEELGQKIDELSRTIELRSKLMSAEAKSNAETELMALRQKHHVAANKLDKFRSESGEAWQEFKVGMTAAWKELSQACDRARQKYGKSEATEPTSPPSSE